MGSTLWYGPCHLLWFALPPLHLAAAHDTHATQHVPSPCPVTARRGTTDAYCLAAPTRTSSSTIMPAESWPRSGRSRPWVAACLLAAAASARQPSGRLPACVAERGGAAPPLVHRPSSASVRCCSAIYPELSAAIPAFFRSTVASGAVMCNGQMYSALQSAPLQYTPIYFTSPHSQLRKRYSDPSCPI